MSGKIRGRECAQCLNRCGYPCWVSTHDSQETGGRRGQGFLLCYPLINLGGGCIEGCTHIHVEGWYWIAESCRVLVSWGALGSDAAKTCPEMPSFWLRCSTEEFTLWVLFLELQGKRDPQSYNQRAGRHLQECK